MNHAPAARQYLARVAPVILAATALVVGTLAARSAVGTVHQSASPARHGQLRRGSALLPIPARGPVSAVLGRNDSAYWVRGWSAANPAQRFTTQFSSSGVVVASAGSRISLRLAALGRGDALSALPSTGTQFSANGVTFVHSGVREWYLNGPLGLEQGFNISSRPAGQGALTLSIALSHGVRARLDGTGATFQSGEATLRYSGLLATDAHGRVLPAWLVLTGSGLQIRVDDRGASYPLRIDPMVQQGSELLASDAAGNASEGMSVALSADGNTALVGGSLDDNGQGAAWVFTRSGSTWTQQGPKLEGSDATAGASEGGSVALSGDGNTALIGGTDDDNSLGAAWVFTRSGSTWTQQGPKLVGSDATAGAEQGFSVALSSDGNTALVGGAGDNDNLGAAWVFTRSGSTWTQEGPKLVASDATPHAEQGYSVALSSDASTALVGGPNDSGGVGAAWAFTWNGSTWTQQGPKLVASDSTGDPEQGFSVALSAVGNTALVGGPTDNSYVGAAWVYTRSGSTWTQQGPKLVASDASGNAYQGFSVGLSSDGRTAIVGGPADNHNVGAAWLFKWSGSSWTQDGSKFSALDPGGPAYEGFSVALSSDGSTALLGGPHDNGGVGGAWAFSTAGAQSTTQQSLTVTIAGNGSGTVSGPSIACSQTCAQTYPAGTVVTLTASATPGSSFAGWSGACSGTGACNVTMNADRSVKATFVPGSSGSGGEGANSVDRPVLSALKISPHNLVLTGRFARGECVAATHSNRNRPVCARPIKSRVTFRLNTSANVTLTIKRVLAGRRVRGRCVKPTQLNRTHHRCSRLVSVHGTIVRSGNRGGNGFVFNDKIGGRKLGPGSYVLIATPSANGLLGTPQTVAFTITG